MIHIEGTYEEIVTHLTHCKEVAQINAVIRDVIYDNGYYVNEINRLIFEVAV